MRLSLIRIVKDLSRQSSESFVRLLAQHLDATLVAANLVHDFLSGKLPLDEARRALRAAEHEGDALRAQLVRELALALVTPVDREDLFRLSRAIDDVLDNLRDFLREWYLYEMSQPASLLVLIEAVVQVIRKLHSAVASLVDSPRDVTRRALAAKKACNVIRREYERQIATLYKQDLSMDVLKRRDLLRRLDVVGMRLNEAADVLSDALIKRGD